MRKEQQRELNKQNSKINAQLENEKSGFKLKTLDNIELVMFEDRIYVPRRLRERTINWYHYYLCHPGEDRLYNTLKSVCFWDGMKNQIRNFSKRCEVCQKGKKRKRKYGHLPPKNVGELTPWDTVHVDLIGPYSLSAKQQQPDGSVVDKDFSLTCMTFVDPATGWFEIAEVPTYLLYDESKKDTREAIDKTSARISQIFDQVWLSRYPRPKQVIFDNGSEFKKDFIPLLRDFAIKPKPTMVKNPQSNSPVERIHQVIMNMFNTQGLKDRVFDFIDPWGEILSSIAWAICASHHSTLDATPAQLVFGRDMLFNIQSFINWKEITRRKQQSVDQANRRENSRRVNHDYSVGDQVYITRTDIHRKLDGPKTGRHDA